MPENAWYDNVMRCFNQTKENYAKKLSKKVSNQDLLTSLFHGSHQFHHMIPNTDIAEHKLWSV